RIGRGRGNVHCGWNAAGPLVFRKMSGSQNACSYRGDVLALVVELNLNPEVSKPTIKLILSRSNVQPMAHAAHSLFRRCGHLDVSGFLPQVPTDCNEVR